MDLILIVIQKLQQRRDVERHKAKEEMEIRLSHMKGLLITLVNFTFFDSGFFGTPHISRKSMITQNDFLKKTFNQSFLKEKWTSNSKKHDIQ